MPDEDDDVATRLDRLSTNLTRDALELRALVAEMRGDDDGRRAADQD